MNNSSDSESPKLSRDQDSLKTLHLNSIIEELCPTQWQLEMSQTGNDLEEIFNSSPTIPGIILTDKGQLVGMVSRRRFLEILSRAYGRELFLKRSLYIFYRFAKKDALILPGNTKIVEAAEQAIQRKDDLIYEPIIVKKSSQKYGVLAIQNLLTAQSYIHQLATELLEKKTQAQLIQTEKLAMLGQMLAGVAHEIRNPVACIVGNIQCLSNYSDDLLELMQTYEKVFPEPKPILEELKDEVDLEFIKQDVPEVVKSLQISSQRLSQMVTSLRGYSRTDAEQRQQANLHECLDNTLLILKNRLKSGIEVIKDYDNIPKISCYPGQISQVFMNLIANAIDVLEENRTDVKIPTISIKTELKSNDWIEENLSLQNYHTAQEQSLQNHASSSNTTTELLTRNPPQESLSSSSYISIRIIDNGSGIPPEIQERIFDNFFTTKPMGKGTGLGLTISHHIVTQRHKGKLKLKSTVGEGTEFEVLLPLI